MEQVSRLEDNSVVSGVSVQVSAPPGRERPVDEEKKLHRATEAFLWLWERFVLASRCFLAG